MNLILKKKKIAASICRSVAVLGFGVQLLRPGLCPAAGPWVAPATAAEMLNPTPAPHARESVRRGRILYEDRCADCHGRKGRGDGAGGIDLEPKPTDLTRPPCTEQTDGALFWKVTEGRRPMPAYGRKLSEAERWDVINYIRSLVPKPKQRPGPRQASVPSTKPNPTTP